MELALITNNQTKLNSINSEKILLKNELIHFENYQESCKVNSISKTKQIVQ